MKKGKRLLIMLLTFLFAIGMFTVVSSAAANEVTESHQGNTYTFTYEDPDGGYHSGTYEFAANDVTYNKTEYGDSNAKFTKVSGNNFHFTLVSTKYTGTASSTTPPVDAGEYSVTRTYRVHYYEGSLPFGKPVQVTVSDDFEITPKQINTTDLLWQAVPGGSYGSDIKYTYDKQSHVPYASIDQAALEAGDTCSVTVTGEQTNVGTYTATATEVDNKNYELPANNTKSFAIEPKTVTFSWDCSGAIDPAPHPDAPSYYYTGEPQAPSIDKNSITGVESGDDCTVIVKEDSKRTEVGDYTAAAELTGDDKDNYKIGGYEQQKFYIEKKKVQPVWSDKKLIYNAQIQHPAVKLAYTDGSDITDADAAKVEVKVYSDAACTQEVTTKTVVGTQYYAKAFLTDDTDFDFDPDHPVVEPFIIYAKTVTVTLTSADPITYDGEYHKPEVEIKGVYDSDGCEPVEALKGTTKITMIGSDGTKTNTVDIKDVNVDEEPGVYHASVNKYTATVKNENTVAPENEKYDVSISGLKGDDARNYVLKNDVTCKFEIRPLEVALDWYRPAYDEYGDETDSDGVLVDVDNGEKLKLVFNGKKQAPTATIKKSHLKTNPETGELDECVVTVSAPSEAVEAREEAYQATDISFSNPDYKREQSGTAYYIIAHPVKLKWNKTETTYNGKEQKCEVEITNIQKTDRGKDYSAGDGIGVVKVSKITYVPGYHFGSDGVDSDESESSFDGETGYYTPDGEAETGLAKGTAIAEDRTPIDAGTYVMTVAELSDPYNYTLVKIDPDTVELDPAYIPDTEQPAFVDDHHPIYTIHQYEIKKIDWTNNPVTYNASNQKPVVAVNKSDLQGPDTNKQVDVMFHDNLDSEVDDFAGKCNADTYDLYVLKNSVFRGIKGDRSMNYFIGEKAKDMTKKFVINKKDLTVTVYDKTGHYGDDPATYKHGVKYSGLVNGDVNKDDNHENKNIPGKYTNDDGVTKDVVDTSKLQFTTNYKLYGKPGKYSVSASGLESDNYAIKYVAGTLTIKDRNLASDLVAKAKAGSGKGTISWKKVYGANKYQIYFSYCNNATKKYTPKLYKTVSGKKNKYTVKKLDKYTYYKYYVVALDKNGKRIAKTEEHHFCTNNEFEHYTNPKTVKASKAKVTVKNGGTYKLKANVTKVKNGYDLTNGDHTKKLRYRSGNKKVATVTKKGVIKGVGAGWCRVYVMGANGVWQAVEVTVK